MMRGRILVVGDAERCAGLARLLSAAGYAIEIAADAAHVRRISLKGIGLAVVLPAVPGDNMRGLIRTLEMTVGIQVLVAASDASLHIGGAIDLSDPTTVLAKVRDVLRAAPAVEGEARTIYFSGHRFDVAEYRLLNNAGDEVPLTKSEHRLLREFLEKPGRVLSREHLLRAVSGRDAEVYDRSIDMLVVRLRRKIEPDPKRPIIIATVPGVGYRFSSSALGTADSSLDIPATEAPSPGERRQVTVLSAELVASLGTRFPIDPFEAKPLLVSCRTRAATEISRFGGALGQGVGRDLLAYFGYPIAQEDAVERAIKAALAIADREGGPDPLAVRVGIATGAAVAEAATGIVGNIPECAACIRSLAPPGGVVIDALTRRLGGRLFKYEPVHFGSCDGPLPDAAWTVVGPSTLLSRSATLYESRTNSLVGRLEERDLLLRAWENASDGVGQVILLSGEPGIGKSRLLAELQEWVASDPHLCLSYFFSPLYQESPLHPIIARWGQEIGFARDDTVGRRWDRLEAFFAPTNLARQDVALLAAMLGLEVAGRYPLPETSPKERKNQTFALLMRMFVDLAYRRPLLVLVEDAHWADSSSLELLDAIVDCVPDLPILLIVSARPNFSPSWSGSAGVRLLALNRLSRKESAALVGEVISGGRLMEDMRERIVTQADGVPLFLEELTKAVLDAGPTNAIAPLPIPTTLWASLMARLDRLPDAKRVAQIAAVVGREFTLDILTAISVISSHSLTKGIDDLVSSGLLSRRGGEEEVIYAFKHALVQETVYDSLLSAPRRDIHRRIAEALRIRHIDLTSAEPEVVAHHFERADLPALAVEWFILAGEMALRRPAYQEAIAHLEAALRLVETLDERADKLNFRLRLQVAYGNALRIARGFGLPETQAAFAAARDLSTVIGNIPERLSAYYGLWSASFQRGELPRMREIAATFLLDAEDGARRPEAAVAHRICGSTHWFEGNFGAAQHHFEHALSINEAARDGELAYRFGQDVAASAMAGLALTLWPMGFVERACDLARQSIDRALATQHIPTIAYCYGHAVIFEMMCPERQRSTPHARALLGLARRHGMVVWVATGLLHDCWSRWGQVETGAGLAKMREGLAIMRSHRQEAFMPLPIMLLAEMEADAGRLEVGLSTIDEQISRVELTGQRWFLSELQRRRGDIMLRQQPDGATAEAAYSSAIETARAQGAKLFELQAAARLGRLWAEKGKRHEARSLLAPLCEWFEGPGGGAVLEEARTLCRID